MFHFCYTRECLFCIMQCPIQNVITVYFSKLVPFFVLWQLCFVERQSLPVANQLVFVSNQSFFVGNRSYFIENQLFFVENRSYFIANRLVFVGNRLYFIENQSFFDPFQPDLGSNQSLNKTIL